jgi:polyphosphate kinase
VSEPESKTLGGARARTASLLEKMQEKEQQEAINTDTSTNSLQKVQEQVQQMSMTWQQLQEQEHLSEKAKARTAGCTQ